jgi:hypothetical protein
MIETESGLRSSAMKNTYVKPTLVKTALLPMIAATPTTK